MEVIKLDKKKAEKEAKELKKKYAEERMKKEHWERFKNSYYWNLTMEVLDEVIDEYKDINKVVPQTVTPKDFEELGKITVLRIGIYEGIKKIKQKFLDK
jgi:transcription termination factor NusB